MEIMNKIGDQMTIKNGYRGTLRVEAPPIGAGEIHQILQQLALFSGLRWLVVDAKELEMGWTGERLGDVRFVRVNALEPNEALARTQLNFGGLEGHEAVDRAVDAEEPVSVAESRQVTERACKIGCRTWDRPRQSGGNTKSWNRQILGGFRGC